MAAFVKNQLVKKLGCYFRDLTGSADRFNLSLLKGEGTMQHRGTRLSRVYAGRLLCPDDYFANAKKIERPNPHLGAFFKSNIWAATM